MQNSVPTNDKHSENKYVYMYYIYHIISKLNKNQYNKWQEIWLHPPKGSMATNDFTSYWSNTNTKITKRSYYKPVKMANSFLKRVNATCSPAFRANGSVTEC